MGNLVFGSSYASAYDALYREKDYDAECALILAGFETVATGPFQTLIDFGCGTGEHALRFARDGMRVHGIDLSSDMLSIAASKASNAGLSEHTSFTAGDVATTKVDGVFDAAIMMFAVLCYQSTNSGLLETLRNVREHLSAGAPFVSDVWYGPAVLHDRPGDRIRRIDQNGKTILRTTSTRLNTTSHLADVNFGLWVFEGDRVSTQSSETHRMRYLFPQEIKLLLDLSGFELVSLTAFPTLDTPVSDSSWNALIVAKAI
jgi:SAM-dependent methyltransferase